MGDNKIMELGKKQRIHTFAKNLRTEIATLDDLAYAMSILFKGEAEVSTDLEGQIMVYTGHSYGLCSLDVRSMSGNKEFLDCTIISEPAAQ